jgi:hypothetical protein
MANNALCELTAAVYNAFYLPGVIDGISRRAPDTADAKLTAAAGFVVPGTVHLPPTVRAAGNDSPPLTFRIA